MIFIDIIDTSNTLQQYTGIYSVLTFPLSRKKRERTTCPQQQYVFIRDRTECNTGCDDVTHILHIWRPTICNSPRVKIKRQTGGAIVVVLVSNAKSPNAPNLLTLP